MKYTHYFFDWDGCLADTYQSWIDSYFPAINKRGINIDLKVLRERAWGNHEQGPKNLGIVDFVECWQEIVDSAQKSLERASLHKNAKSILNILKQNGSKVAIVTSLYRDVIERAIRFNEIGNLVDFLITKNEVINTKPHPEPVVKTLEFFGVHEADALMIGDTEGDVLAGKQAGIDTALILHEKNRRFFNEDMLKSSGPKYIIRDFKELLKLD